MHEGIGHCKFCKKRLHMLFTCITGKYLLPKIRDTAGQKGTGKWTGISALEYGVPVTLIGEAVFARCLSALKGMSFSEVN